MKIKVKGSFLEVKNLEELLNILKETNSSLEDVFLITSNGREISLVEFFYDLRSKELRNFLLLFLDLLSLLKDEIEKSTEMINSCSSFLRDKLEPFLKEYINEKNFTPLEEVLFYIFLSFHFMNKSLITSWFGSFSLLERHLEFFVKIKEGGESAV